MNLENKLIKPFDEREKRLINYKLYNSTNKYTLKEQCRFIIKLEELIDDEKLVDYFLKRMALTQITPKDITTILFKTQQLQTKEKITLFIEKYVSNEAEKIRRIHEEEIIFKSYCALIRVGQEGDEKLLDKVISLITIYSDEEYAITQITGNIINARNKEKLEKTIEKYSCQKFTETLELFSKYRPKTESLRKIIFTYTSPVPKNQELKLTDELCDLIVQYKYQVHTTKIIIHGLANLKVDCDLKDETNIVKELSAERFRKLLVDNTEINQNAIEGFSQFLVRHSELTDELYATINMQEEQDYGLLLRSTFNQSHTVITKSSDALRMIELFKQKNKIGAEIAICLEYFMKQNKDAVIPFIQICEEIKTESPNVYEEIKKEIETEDVTSILDAVLKNKKYLNQQKPECIAPMIKIISEIGYEEELTKLNKYQTSQLCKAYAIAKQNINPETITEENRQGKNFLVEFYAGLQDTLKTDYEHLDKWCEAIIDGLAEVARTGQSLSEVMSYGN